MFDAMSVQDVVASAGFIIAFGLGVVAGLLS